MKKKNTLFLGFILSCCGFFLNATITMAASSVISQTFNSPIAFFNPDGKTKYIFSDGVIYSATKPYSAQTWDDSGVRAAALDTPLRYYDFTTESIAYDGFSYIGVRTEDFAEGDEQGTSAIYGTSIWRVGKEAGSVVFELVYESSNESIGKYFQTLFTHKKALYAVRTNGEIWKTKNGTKWFKVHSKTFPKYAGITDYHAVTLDNTIYLGIEGSGLDEPEIYTSKNGSKWKLFEGSYQDAATGNGTETIGITDITIIDNSYSYYLYVTIVNDVTGVTSLWRYYSYDDSWSQINAGYDDTYSFVGATQSYSEGLVYYSNSTIFGCSESGSSCEELDSTANETIIRLIPTFKNVVFLMYDSGYYLKRM